ncbi:MAG: hypothetical protein LBD01_05600 [Puniceicoccales bacterium]|jgi:hypothetical protein|nr:hypothetical protein [Puniceicoccales bacterium]
MSSALSFSNALRFPCFSLLALLGLAACEPSLSENYIFHGNFSAKHEARVREVYKPANGKLELSLAFLDLDGDGVLDLTVQFKNGRAADLWSATMHDRGRALFGLPEHMQRPANVAPSAELESLVAAISMQPSQQAVRALYDSTELGLLPSWVLALQLRKAVGTSLAAEVAANASAAVEKGSLVEQSLFILSALGTPGNEALGKALGKVQDKRIAKAIIQILDTNNAFLTLLENQPIRLGEADREDVRDAFFKALEHMASTPSSSILLRENVARLDELANVHPDVARQVKFLRNALLQTEAAMASEEEKQKNPEKIKASLRNEPANPSASGDAKPVAASGAPM